MNRPVLAALLGAAAGYAARSVYRAAYSRTHKPSPRLKASLYAALGPARPPRDRWLMQAAGTISGSLDPGDRATALYAVTEAPDGLLRTCALERGQEFPWVLFGDHGPGRAKGGDR